jgi:hypothetical protein
MTNILWAFLGAVIGGCLGVTVMAILQIGRESDKDFDRLSSVWVGFVDYYDDSTVLLVHQVRSYGINLYIQNPLGDFIFITRLLDTFTDRVKMEDYVRNYVYKNGPFLFPYQNKETEEDKP